MTDSEIFNLTPVVYVPGNLTITSMEQLNKRYVFTGAAPTLTMAIPSPTVTPAHWLEVINTNVGHWFAPSGNTPLLKTKAGDAAWSIGYNRLARFVCDGDGNLQDITGFVDPEPM